jgi:hypothetical protein
MNYIAILIILPNVRGETVNNGAEDEKPLV